MFRKRQIITFPALLALSLLLTGCPPPADYTQWRRASTTVDEVKAAKAECGDPVAGPQNRFTTNESALQFLCMQRLGFKRTDGFDFCRVIKDIPACVEMKKGRPLTLSELEALPFRADDGFFPIKPDSGRYENMQISWRKVGASPHFSVQIANDHEALPVMYACGYPQPLGSNLDVASIGRTAIAQRCMIDHGFEPKDKMILVCGPYPNVTGCESSD